MPELIHSCGKKVRFPSGTEGKRGRCPHCGESLLVPDDGPRERMQLDPPPMWDEYLAYLNDEGPPPRPVVMPSRLMLATEADEKWERAADKRPSKFNCPNCKERLNVDQLICTGCGVDFRTGKQLGGKAKLNEKAMAYLEQIPWLAEARRRLEAGEDEAPDDGSGEKPSRFAGKAPRPRKKR